MEGLARTRRLKDPGGVRKSPYEITQMWDRHHELARLAALGFSNEVIAEKLGMQVGNVSRLKNTTLVLEKIKLLQGVADKQTVTIRQEIEEMAPIALAAIKAGMADETPVHIRAANGFKLLGILGHVAPKNIRLSTEGHITVEDITEIKRRAAELLNPVDTMEIIDAEVQSEVSSQASNM